MSAPAVLIVIDFEASAPQVRAVFEHEGDELRMRHWLEAHPMLQKMVDRALALADQERAA